MFRHCVGIKTTGKVAIQEVSLPLNLVVRLSPVKLILKTDHHIVRFCVLCTIRQ
jgi:hypothetical protein